MRATRTNAFRSLLASLVGLWAIAGFGASHVLAADDPPPPLAIQFSLDRPIDAAAAPFVMAATGGLFSAEALAVTINIASGSSDAIARVAAGTSDFALVDINALMRFRDKDKQGGPRIKAVFVLFNKSPYAIIARKSRGVQALSDIEGKTLGVAEGDLSIRLWPAVAKQNGIKIKSVKQSSISAAVREPMLSAGQIDAVTGFSYLSTINLRDRGVPADDLAVLKFADYGCEAYGFAIIVNPALAAGKPEAVKAFVRATIGGMHLTVRDPGRAATEVVNRMDGGSRDLELERLHSILRDNILTGEARRNGIGGIDPARFERSIEQVAEDFKFQKRPQASDVFDDQYLPPLGGRLIN
ncbi:ABC transporter substrate-binding protein [Bradyrhizobium sp. TZ2]